jgi:Tfp pilus assembly protein PilX
MVLINRKAHTVRKGAALIISMIFVLIFSALAVSMAAISGTNVQVASNHHKLDSALSAAESGLECGRYIIAKTLSDLPSTPYNTVTTAQADEVWSILCTTIQDESWVNNQAELSGSTITTPAITYGNSNGSFQVMFNRTDTFTIELVGVGNCGEVTKLASIQTSIEKDREILNYAVASRGRMWLTGDSTIYGDVFSSWDRAEISPFNMTNDTCVLGTINTVLTLDQIQNEDYQMETLDVNGNPLDVNGVLLGNNFEDRYYGPDDEIKAYHEGINYGQEDQTQGMPGMDIDDYDTDGYDDGLTEIAECPYGDRETEYFPHASGNYNYPRDGSPYSTWNRRMSRHVYEGQTFTNAKLPNDRNALFRDCTFEEVLYIDCAESGSTNYNNVRFENCTFNGVIVTDVPEVFKWTNNCLYFTGEATFENTSSVQEATILAPHFNVNLGNTNPEQSENNILTGAIIGGIVDVRGNAQIYGTIISMCDTTQWSSGYVTNIGATLDDGGSETTELGDIGTIEITPDEEQMLPNGIISPIIIKPSQGTYSEG